jgi:hypothetical protein
VERLSQKIAQERKSRAFYISHNSVTDIENRRFVPRLAKLYSLSVIYHWGLDELLSLFGLSINDPGKERGLLTLPHTHLLHAKAEAEDSDTLSGTHRQDTPELERTNLVHRMRMSWGEISLSLLRRAGPRHALYGYIGVKDYTLDPLIRPGSIVQIDSQQTKIMQGLWVNEFDRPIYFFELRNNHYVCSWGELNGDQLLLIPSPRSPVQVRHLRFPQDADIVGRVTAVSMTIADSSLPL